MIDRIVLRALWKKYGEATLLPLEPFHERRYEAFFVNPNQRWPPFRTTLVAVGTLDEIAVMLLGEEEASLQIQKEIDDQKKRVAWRTSADAVDPVLASSGEPSTRDGSSSSSENLAALPAGGAREVKHE